MFSVVAVFIELEDFELDELDLFDYNLLDFFDRLPELGVVLDLVENYLDQLQLLEAFGDGGSVEVHYRSVGYNAQTNR